MNDEEKFCALLDRRDLSPDDWRELYRLARELDESDAVAAREAIDELEAGVVRVQ